MDHGPVPLSRRRRSLVRIRTPRLAGRFPGWFLLSAFAAVRRTVDGTPERCRRSRPSSGQIADWIRPSNAPASRSADPGAIAGTSRSRSVPAPSRVRHERIDQVDGAYASPSTRGTAARAFSAAAISLMWPCAGVVPPWLSCTWSRSRPALADRVERCRRRRSRPIAAPQQIINGWTSMSCSLTGSPDALPRRASRARTARLRWPRRHGGSKIT